MKDLWKLDLLEINKLLDQGSLSSEELVLYYLNRISKIDNGTPKYNSILEVNPDALNIAKQMDYERQNGKKRSLMHGIPIVLKDNINTNDKMHTTAGSITLQDNFATSDAFIVKRLRESGAVILGKANLTEFANFVSYNMRNGFSSLGGEVLCPYNLKYDPSGSSAGSAVSVALNLTPVSIGTETGGSIMSPSMQNGVVGMKPTIGLLSRSGIIPISSTLDTAGPMAKTVTDVAVLLNSLYGNDKEDPITNTKKETAKPYINFLDKEGLKNARIGVVRNRVQDLSKEHIDTFNETLEVMKKNGATLIEDMEVNQPSYIFNIMKYEFKRNINKYLSTTSSVVPVKSLEDVIEYNKNNESIALQYGQQLLEDCQNTSGKMNEKEYIDALKERDELTEHINDIFNKHNLHIIYFSGYTSLGPMCGFPTMTIPLGFTSENMPIGGYFLARHFEEGKLIKILYSLEQNTKKRRNPINE